MFASQLLPTLRLIKRIGDDASDLELSDGGSITSSESESSDDSEDEFDGNILGLSLSHSATSLMHDGTGVSVSLLADAQAEREFRAEVSASLARAFSEGHSVDNAAVELKTLRMASNVPLRRVREAVVAGIVDLIPIVSDSPARQRAEIAKVMDRWGELINLIGGVDAVETVSVLQVRIITSRIPDIRSPPCFLPWHLAGNTLSSILRFIRP